jgi:hypothetical protein
MMSPTTQTSANAGDRSLPDGPVPADAAVSITAVIVAVGHVAAPMESMCIAGLFSE